MKNPLVSIICTNFNKGEWIRAAIESFLAQKADFEFEILIIDDASTDNSKDIIREFAEKNPEKIRFFENEKNLGITRTWKKICIEARGKYIARCDGDDFWMDDKKLQKQIDLLKKTGAKWANSDFDIINEKSEITARGAFENGVIVLADTFEKMLATRGFTNASTWVVEADLMRDVNSRVPDDAADDTFNIQLELFLKTKLATLKESVAVYRVNEGSDSHPQDAEKVRKRNESLSRTQLEYFEKSPEKIKNKIFEITLKEFNKNVNFIHNKNRENSELEKHVKYLDSEIDKFKKQEEQFRKEELNFRKIQDELRKIYGSIWWKIGKPLRLIEKVIRRK